MFSSQPMNEKYLFLNILKISPNFSQKNRKISFRLNENGAKNSFQEQASGSSTIRYTTHFSGMSPFKIIFFARL